MIARARRLLTAQQAEPGELQAVAGLLLAYAGVRLLRRVADAQLQRVEDLRQALAELRTYSEACTSAPTYPVAEDLDPLGPVGELDEPPAVDELAGAGS